MHFLAFSVKCAHFRKMRAEIAKNKFSDIGLASSKGSFFERPNQTLHDTFPSFFKERVVRSHWRVLIISKTTGRSKSSQKSNDTEDAQT